MTISTDCDVCSTRKQVQQLTKVSNLFEDEDAWLCEECLLSMEKVWKMPLGNFGE